jgi:hypothetical protein
MIVKQIKLWFQKQSRTSRSAVARVSIKRNVSLRQVVCHEYKDEIASIAKRRASGAKPGEKEYLGVFQGAVTEFITGLDEEEVFELENKRAEWVNNSQPVEHQRKTAERNGRSYLQKSAELQYKQMGMRSVVWEFHENKSGTKLFQLLIYLFFKIKTHL